MRKNSGELPGSGELAKILAHEANRKLPPGKRGVHYPDFSLATELFQAYGESGRIFRKDIKMAVFLKEGKLITDRVTEKIINDKAPTEKKSLLNRVYDYLSEEDKPLKSDLIFVFGSDYRERAKTAVSLYKNNLAPKLLFSGHGPIWDQSRPIEALEYQKYAIANGVPRGAIIVEDRSITTADNIKRSLNLLDKLGVKFGRIILVNSTYSQRRGWCHFRKYLPNRIKLFRVNCVSRQEYQRDQWFKSRAGVRRILNEFTKMKIAVILDTA